MEPTPPSTRASTTANDQEHLLSILDGIDDVIYVADPESYELLYVNRAFRDNWGDGVIGKKCFKVLQDRDEPCPFCTNDKIFGAGLGEVHTWEFQNELTKRWYQCEDRAIPWRDNRMVRFELARDITEQKTTQSDLQESIERFDRITDLLPDMIYCMTLPDGHYEYVSPASRRIFGHTPDEFAQNPGIVQKLLHPDWHAYFEREWEKLLAGQAPPIYEYQIIAASGETRWLNQRNVVLSDESGSPNAIWGIVTDVTAGKEAETSLRERIKELTCLQQVGRLVQREGVSTAELLRETARALSSGFQYPAFARVGIGDDNYDTGDFGLCVARISAPVKLGKETVGSVAVGYRDEHPASYDGPFLREERELIEAVADTLGSYAIRKRALEGLARHQKELEQRVEERTAELTRQTEKQQRLAGELSTIIDSVPGLVFYKDTQNRYLRVNQYVADAHQMKKEELEGRDLFDIYPREQAQAYFDDDLQVIESGQSKLNIEERWETADGPRWVSTSKIPHFDEKDAVIGVIGVAMDITERREAEEALARKSRITTSINRVLHEAISRQSPVEVANEALKVAEELTGSSFGFIGEINEDGKFDTISISNPGWEACSIEGSTATMLIQGMELRGIWAAVLKSGKPLIVNDPSAHPDRVGVPAGHPPLTGFLGVPFLREGRAVGMIALANKTGAYDETDLEAVEALCGPFYETLLRKRLEAHLREQSNLEAAQAELSRNIVGDHGLEDLCDNILNFVCGWLQSPSGLMYVADESDTLRLGGTYAYKKRADRDYAYRLGEGLVGQAARDRKELILDDLPEAYFPIESGLGAGLPRQLYIKPIVHNGRVRAVLELALLRGLDGVQPRFLEITGPGIAAAVESAQARQIQQRLLEQAQRMSEELQAQQEELRAANEELEEQTQLLLGSENNLKEQREELQVTNEELEEKTELLERQKRDIELASEEIAEKAEDLALASKYKSEFLANMSHELRTPLNSLLLLSRSLTENKEKNLTADQLESCRVIHEGGNELLSLINEILDLSKIEAGKMELRCGEVHLSDLAASLRVSFQSMAEKKGIDYDVAIESGAPTPITSDRKRIELIVKNLVANAIKFTERGHVKITFGSMSGETAPGALDPEATLRITVEDTGIGIPPQKQKIIFEAFQQADGSTARKYGGTGLGLSIVKELSHFLGGAIQLTSEPGRGSTFTVYLPVAGPALAGDISASSDRPRDTGRREPRRATLPVVSIADDRENLDHSDRSMLVIEDDPRFAEVLAGQCRERGFKVLAAATGEAGIELAESYLPSGIILDLKLPGMDGWRALELLKEDSRTRHIPVHIVSGDDPSPRSLRKGAIGHLQKPLSAEQIQGALAKLVETASRTSKRVLVVEDNEDTRRGIVELIADQNVTVDEAAGGAQAIEALRNHSYDCMILDLGLWDLDGKELLEQLQQDEGIESPPVIVYTARDLTWQEDLDLRSYSDSVIIKGVRSDERLIDEVSLFLHTVVADMPKKKQQIIANLHDIDAMLRGKKVLVVDDDMRALFALTKILSDRGMQVIKAENGEKGLGRLELEPDVDIVLMDIMMPVLDGYETIKRIRAQARFKKLPIVALTAKAMQDDRDRCIEAGANDYLPKPVDQDRLVSMLRVWLY